MKAAAVIVLMLSIVVTSVVVHRLLRPILERNEYYVSEKRERESRSHVEFCICFLWYSSTYTLSAIKRYVTIFKRKIRNVVSRIQRIGCQLEKNNFTRWPIPLVVCCLVLFCVFFPSILDINESTSRGHTRGRSHRISHLPSFCSACLDFSREKDSAIPFPRQP